MSTGSAMAELRAALVESALQRVLSEKAVPANWGLPRCRCGVQLQDHALVRCPSCVAEQRLRNGRR